MPTTSVIRLPKSSKESTELPSRRQQLSVSSLAAPLSLQYPPFRQYQEVVCPWTKGLIFILGLSAHSPHPPPLLSEMSLRYKPYNIKEYWKHKEKKFISGWTSRLWRICSTTETCQTRFWDGTTRSGRTFQHRSCSNSHRFSKRRYRSQHRAKEN